MPYTAAWTTKRIRDLSAGAAARTRDSELGTGSRLLGGDREIAKMFALTNAERGKMSFFRSLRSGAILRAAGARGHLPRAAPGQSHWVAVERWDALRAREYEEELGRAHALIYERLPKRTKTCWRCRERRAKAIRERKKQLVEKARPNEGSRESNASKRDMAPTKTTAGPSTTLRMTTVVLAQFCEAYQQESRYGTRSHDCGNRFHSALVFLLRRPWAQARL